MSLAEIKPLVNEINGWISDQEAEFLYQTAAGCVGRGVIVEIGSWQGKSTVILARALTNSSIKIYAIDPHINSIEHKEWLNEQSSFELFQKNLKLAGVEHLIEPIVKTSDDASVGWQKPIEFLWIDGDHSYQGAKSDFDKWSPHVIAGGTIAFHDGTQVELPKVISESFSKDGFSSIKITDSIISAKKMPGVKKSLKDWCLLFILKNHRLVRKLKFLKYIKKPIKAATAKL